MTYTVTTQKTWARILDDIEDALSKWGGVSAWRVDAILAPRSSTKATQTPHERRVTLHWTRRGRDYQIAMARQTRAVDNLLVVWLILETLRLNDARGYAREVAQVYRQEFPALPAPGQTSDPVEPPPGDPYAVLYVRTDAPRVVCEAAYKVLARAAHPDAGGSVARMSALSDAIARIRKERPS